MKRHRSPNLADRLSARSARNGDCVEWTGYKNKLGYGKLTFKGLLLSAHRASWIATHGQIPEGRFVCHKCDNRVCINPDHLFLGSQEDNMRDMAVKGRRRGVGGQRGEGHHMAKLDAQKVIAIRASEKSDSELAAIYGMTKRYIWSVRNRVTWKHI